MSNQSTDATQPTTDASRGDKTTGTGTATTTGSKKSPTTTKPPQEAPTFESPLSNTYKLLTTGEKKLTIGFIGASTSAGMHASRGYLGNGSFAPLGSNGGEGGNYLLCYVQATATWFRNQFPDAAIEVVNGGISDTGSNFALFTLQQRLMNTNGHDMPDLVFVDLTRSDVVYETQSAKDLERYVESIIRNIYALNPYAEIIVNNLLWTDDNEITKAHKAVADHYGLLWTNAGGALHAAMKARGVSQESDGNYYYTTDNLHPSIYGYPVMSAEIQKTLKANLEGLKPKSPYLYNYASHLPKAKNTHLVTDPRIIPAEQFTVTGSALKVNLPVYSQMVGMGTSFSSPRENIGLTPSYMQVSGSGAMFSFDFTGTTMGIIFQMSTADINMLYRIDGGQWKTFSSDASSFSWQRYDHAQIFMFATTLEKKTHTVELRFSRSGGQDVNVKLGGAVVG